ncbi:Spy/CpxP family protein refolding chaperone [Magnetofaba australis]|uniref:LTXXQ motif family protein n=1 Tax=Magnetofaba australis IT-1 TaxID=1434232 RepID=A0A1Y2K567_9PROT|nr:Spy/CpxP family protein refolding chaperone [Magnetofaba australis]OSM04134.1 hypothetical protein MAIT1_03592 [Magnetofaba australis IT-1]
MNTKRSGLLSVAAGLALAASVAVVAINGYAHGPGFGMGNGGYPGMMGGQTGMGGPGMMGGQTGMRGPGMMMGQQGMGGMMFQDEEAQTLYLTEFKQRLQITADQEKPWTAYVDALTDVTATHSAMFAQMHDPSISGYERSEAHIALMEQMLPRQRTLLTATRTLRQTLTPTQRTQFDQGSVWFHGGYMNAQ